MGHKKKKKINKPVMEQLPQSSAELAPDIEALLKSYADVFPDQLPSGLTPARPTDHRIVLQKDALPPRYCLYRVPLTQKTELKRQLDELLTAGHIERAQSPFGAGVLFV